MDFHKIKLFHKEKGYYMDLNKPSITENYELYFTIKGELVYRVNRPLEGWVDYTHKLEIQEVEEC